MDSETSLSSRESNSRRRPLHTCAVSVSAIAHKASTKAQDFKDPIGSMTNRIATLATSISPFLYAMQFQWLAVLSFADDHILALENMVESVFPPSTHLFDRIDELLLIAETLPGKFDNAVDKFPMIIRQVPLLDWALVHVIAWLNIFLSRLTYWGSDSTREKEITVDTGCIECYNESTPDDKAHHPMEPQVDIQSENMEKFPPVSETKTGDAGDVKCTYKEMLEKGTKENLEKNDDNLKKEKQKFDVGKEETGEGVGNANGINESLAKDGPIRELFESASKEETGEGGGGNANGSNESIAKDDPILELFESTWHMKPGRGIKEKSKE
ncbi:hypothetical protein L1049_006957 [Liquidambar formosana]|uniref:Uncharacterized protein n=1 Tax=Liquidambar formosana TaxID=63359 RepID=A0AAP0RGB8_LIQFO